MTAFKANYGVGIIEYLTHVRMQTAKRLLSNTEKTVKEISEAAAIPTRTISARFFKALRND